MAAITSSVIGLGSAAYSIYQGEKQRKEAKKAFNEYERQELDNAFEDLPISTLGSDLLMDQSGMAAASSTEAARSAGIRGVFGAIPKIQSQVNRDSQTAARMVDDQVVSRNRAIAQDNVAIRGVQENRDISNLAGIGQQMEVGRQQTQMGVRGLGNSLMYAANNIDWNGDGSTGDTSGNAQGMFAAGGVLDKSIASLERKQENEQFFNYYAPKPYNF